MRLLFFILLLSSTAVPQEQDDCFTDLCIVQNAEQTVMDSAYVDDQLTAYYETMSPDEVCDFYYGNDQYLNADGTIINESVEMSCRVITGQEQYL